ncbi:MAG: hypothetical protein R2792_03455 [Saprospiraceae bacterium]
MCTIGNVFTQAQGNISFKQCDLKDATTFLQPRVTNGQDGIKYYPFLREGSSGPWAGINNFGVSFVAADNYLAFDAQQKPISNEVAQSVFEAYTKILSEHKTATAAKDYMLDFYAKFQGADILLITDTTSAWFIEANDGEIACIERTDEFFASTNHMRMLYEGVPYNQNHSSYLRLDRAQKCLERDPSEMGVVNVLRDQYYGESVFSICRVDGVCPSQEEPYYTQATAILYSDGHVMNAVYQLNGNPRTNQYTVVHDIFGSHAASTDIAVEDLPKHLVKAKVSPRFRFSGCIHPNDKFHQLKEDAADDHVIPPNYVYVPGVGNIPQYAATVYGSSIAYDPPRNCNGYFMSAKFQPNNNCYAYGTNICSNSFPQPGRMHGYLLPSGFTGKDVVHGAQLDGLLYVGTDQQDIGKHAQSVNGVGHYVALMISAANLQYGWPGDYHWARCDVGSPYNSWSQKDGNDQVTNFDFAGNPITNPALANWVVNQGPIGNGNANDLIVSYDFYCYMWVPPTGVSII